MEQTKPLPQKLFISTVLENKDELEEKYEKCYASLQSLVSGLSEKEAQNALNAAVCKDKVHEELSLGLLYAILTEPERAPRWYRDLTLVTRDGLAHVLASLTHLVMERYLRLTDRARSQLLWLVREMIRASVANVDSLCWSLQRHAAGGDVSPRNLVLVEALLDLYTENRAWLDKFPLLTAAAAYTFLRLIEDHFSPSLAALRQREVTFVVTLLRERFSDCLAIGRDLVRLLQNVARIPEVEQLWKDILLNPRSLCPTFTGVLQLLQSRTSRRFLQSRLTPDMERKLVFLTSQVRFGYHKRYQEWFQRQYLATPESQSLRCDLIRFIVGVIHPTNELLCSDIIPRWAVIGWLLTTCTSVVTASNTKLALFYDWLFFDSDKDNIMNIEPAILVMNNSMRSHPAVTATLLDFLCRIVPNFYPALAEKVRAGIYASLRQILDKRVLPSLFPLFDNPKLDGELRAMVHDVFREFCLPPSSEGIGSERSLYSVSRRAWIQPGVKLEDPGVNVKDEPATVTDQDTNHDDAVDGDGPTAPGSVQHSSEPTFSDDDEDPQSSNSAPVLTPATVLSRTHAPRLHSLDEEDDDDIPLAKVRLKEKPTADSDADADIIQQLDGDFRLAVESLHTETDNEARCQAMERLVQLIVQEDDIDSETTAVLGQCLAVVLKEQFEGTVFPEEVNDENIEDSIGKPLFVLLRNLIQLPEDDSRRLPLLAVLAELAPQAQRVGYLLLYFLKACKLNDGKASVYKDFCQTMDKKLEDCLLEDLRLCQEEDVRLLVWLLPEVYAQFPAVAVGNAQLLQLVVSAVDALQLQELVCHILQGRLVMFRHDGFRALLSASLSWETFEQYCLWQLVAAHGIPVDYILPILPRLEFTRHAEALTSILLMLKQERPTEELLRVILSREVRGGDMFVVSALRCWCREHEELLCRLVAQLLTPVGGTNSSPGKRKRGGGNQQPGGKPSPSSGTPPVEQVLGHLDHLRQSCKQNGCRLYGSEVVQRALLQAQSQCSDPQRKRFSDLFALAEVEELEPRGRRGGGGGGGRKPRGKGRQATRPSDSSEDSSEEEEVVKPKQAKKRKKTNPVGSDSD
ncbi:integrator complex subunit 3 isoform X1 [Schistocerca piceifrons]|uniref:integrator complex subunit 3 isoform X1 n=1 Tax=Schistocerca piceifrons TaxID=274613 RepID=UPI001F5F7019|nr:integrator complex subunit 3 isoform X1 [Schistocerca piceifrons]